MSSQFQHKWTLQDRLNYHGSIDRKRGCVRAIAANDSDRLTTAQHTKLWRMCAEGECEKLFGCTIAELSRGAASALIESLTRN